MLDVLHGFATQFSAYAWGPWLLVLLLGGGLYFCVYSRFLPFRHLPHAWALLRGRYDSERGPGELSHFQALSAALAGTIGMGNIAGVAVAIFVGGPGAVFWMWMSAIVGTATKFFTCSLAVMYRGPDSAGDLQGGPMYVIREALPRAFRPLASLFAVMGLIACLPAFQTNQLVQILRESIFAPRGWVGDDPLLFNAVTGAGIALLIAPVVLGGLPRLAATAARIVPGMTLLYVGAALLVLVMNADRLPDMFALILHDAFTGQAVAGGALGAVMLTGVQRGAFSNEAGIGTEALAHGAARTSEPIREGIVAMMGPIIDTLVICSATAFIILLADDWQGGTANGVTMTANAFAAHLGDAGSVILLVCVLAFALTTMLTYSYYGAKCAGYLFGAHSAPYYRYFYLGMIVVAAIVSLETAIGIIDGCFAIMAIPTMTSALLLSPKVMAAARVYFGKYKAG